MAGERLTRESLRRLWRASGRTWDSVPPWHVPRNRDIARAYLETHEPATSIAARYGLSKARVPAIARTVFYTILGRRPPR